MATINSITLITPPDALRNDFHACVCCSHGLLGRDYLGSREEIEAQIREIEAAHPSLGRVLILWLN